MEKIAVIDLGSNSARLVLAEILPNGHFVVFDELKETVRLGQDKAVESGSGDKNAQNVQETLR